VEAGYQWDSICSLAQVKIQEDRERMDMADSGLLRLCGTGLSEVLVLFDVILVC
jgi:hypothetical protein